MHPTTARYLVDSRHADLRAEACRERLANESRRARAQRKGPSEDGTGMVAAIRTALRFRAAAA